MNTNTIALWQDPAPNCLRRHKLITKELAQKIPAMGTYSDSDEIDIRTVKPTVKLFSPYTGWDWYVLEWDAETGECFGLVNGLAQEFGAFDLNELAALTLSGSLPVVERDLYWKPQTVEELQANWRTNQVRN